MQSEIDGNAGRRVGPIGVVAVMIACLGLAVGVGVIAVVVGCDRGKATASTQTTKDGPPGLAAPDELDRILLTNSRGRVVPTYPPEPWEDDEDSNFKKELAAWDDLDRILWPRKAEKLAGLNPQVRDAIQNVKRLIAQRPPVDLVSQDRNTLIEQHDYFQWRERHSYRRYLANQRGANALVKKLHLTPIEADEFKQVYGHYTVPDSKIVRSVLEKTITNGERALDGKDQGLIWEAHMHKFIAGLKN